MASYNIAVIGAGPAGATFARLAARHYKILLVDRCAETEDRLPGAAGKCCGGLLAPDAQAMLSRMGLGLPRDVLVGPQLFVVRAINAQHGTERYYQRHYINMDRRRFDEWLLSLVPADVDLRRGWRFRECRREGDGFTLTFSDRGRILTERANIVVGADGARSQVRPVAFPDHPLPQTYIAIQHWVEANTQLPYFSTLFDQEITDYYGWTIPKEEYLLVGAALHPGPGVRAKFEHLKDRLRSHGVCIGSTVCRQAATILRPISTRQIATARDGVALLGEAAGWISPSSAEGLSYAMHSAVILAEVLSSGREHFEWRYYRRTRALRANIFRKNLKSAVIYRPWLRNLVMRTGLQSIAVDRLHGGKEPIREELNQ